MVAYNGTSGLEVCWAAEAFCLRGIGWLSEAAGPFSAGFPEHLEKNRVTG